MAEYDLVIAGAWIIDGTGQKSYRADVGIQRDRIAAIGDLRSKTTGRSLDVHGLAMAPGFIDTHTHDDRAVLTTPDMTPKVSQGVTTVVVGNCGISLSPAAITGPPPIPLELLGTTDDFRFPTFAEYATEIQRQPPAVNVAALLGHTSLRTTVMDTTDRPASAEEIRTMSNQLDQALVDGAIGMSSGVDYPASAHASTEELIALCRRVHHHRGIYATHLRDESDHIDHALAAAFHIGRVAHVPLVISHIKCAGRTNWGRSTEILGQIRRAQRVQQVALDCYPYTASSTALLPKYLDAAEDVMITWSEPHPERAGRHLTAIAQEWGCDAIEAAERLAPAGAIYFDMDDADVQNFLAADTMIGSDGLFHDPRPHPRLWGTFPRVLGHYSRDLGLFSLEQAVHRMTAKPAQVFGFADRGHITEGAFADLVVFDPDTIADTATFDQPAQRAVGIHAVLVNGTIVWQQSRPTGARPGRLLNRALVPKDNEARER